MFDELSTYQNPDYDVSFYTEKWQAVPGLGSVALAISATANRTHQSNWPRRAS